MSSLSYSPKWIQCTDVPWKKAIRKEDLGLLPGGRLTYNFKRIALLPHCLIENSKFDVRC
jgi:hypothetical protein